MATFRPVAVWGLNVPSDGEPTPALDEGAATFRITMAAIDPTVKPEQDADGKAIPFATLKMIRLPGFTDDFFDEDDDDDDDEESFDLQRLLEGASDDEESDEENVNGKQSDSRKATKALKKAAAEDEDEDDEENDDDDDGAMVNGDLEARITKGKGKDIDIVDGVGGDENEDDEDDEEYDEEDDDSDMYDEPDIYTLCTLDPSKNYQQALDITVNYNEQVLFQVSGGYDITLTGNYLVPVSADVGNRMLGELEEDDEWDLSPSEDEELDMLDMVDVDEESDELDDLDDLRVMEVDSEEEQIPELVESKGKKGKKRAAADSDEDTTSTKPSSGLTNGEQKLSKKQLKKLKKNDGAAAEVTPGAETTVKPVNGKADKKVQFAKDLEQGPSSSPNVSAAKTTEANKDKPTTNGAKGGLGVKVVNGVTIDDRKLGSGVAAKKGDKVSMRYIGKLQSNGKVFDSNKKGKPFSFNLGKKEVIQGWDIGVEGMTVGSERRITIPAQLAYGKKGAGPDIPPNSTLVFDVKMLEIK